MSEVRHPTTEQLHAHSHLMAARTNGNWPFGPGTAAGLKPGAVHEVKLLQSGYDFFTFVPANARRRFPFRPRPTERHYIHRVAAYLVILGRRTPEMLLMDVLATEWEKWL
jgi:hypothetical protein